MQNFTIISKIGKGPQGTVYKIKKNEEILAMKKINLTHLSVDEQEQILKKQSQYLKLKHNHLINYHNVYLSHSYLYLIMDYAENLDLTHYIKKNINPLQEQFIWSFCYQIIQILHYLHSLRIIHGNLKPANILIKLNLVFQVTDIKNPYYKPNRYEACTPLNLTPEKINNNKQTEKGDIWSLGCLAYVLCNQHAPFYSNKLSTLQEQILNKFPRIIQLNYTKDLHKFIQIMMEKNSDQRPNSDFLIKYFDQNKFGYLRFCLDNKKKKVQFNNKEKISSQTNEIKKIEENIKQSLQQFRSRSKSSLLMKQQLHNISVFNKNQSLEKIKNEKRTLLQETAKIQFYLYENKKNENSSYLPKNTNGLNEKQDQCTQKELKKQKQLLPLFISEKNIRKISLEKPTQILEVKKEIEYIHGFKQEFF